MKILSRRRIFGKSQLIAALSFFIFVRALYRLYLTAVFQLESPVGINLERSIWNTIYCIKKGIGPYAEEIIKTVPYHLNMYTPLYHYLVAALPEFENPFTTARLISGLFMIGAASFLLWRGRVKKEYSVSLLLFSIFISISPVIKNSFMARQDSMALFFSCLSICVLSSGIRKLNVIAAALFASLAVASKQSYISPLIATPLYLFFRHRAFFKIYIASAMSLLFCGGIFAQVQWGNVFWWSIIFIPSHTGYSIENFVIIFSELFSQAICFSVFCVILVALIRRLKNDPTEMSLIFFYMFTSFAVLSMTITKQGASTNYLYEPILASLLFLQEELSKGYLTLKARNQRFILLACLILSFFADQLFLTNSMFALTDASQNELSLSYVKHLKKDIAEAGTKIAPREVTHVLFYRGLQNEMASLNRPAVFGDPYLYNIIFQNSIIDKRVIVDDVRNRKFDLIALPPGANFSTLKSKTFGNDFFEAITTFYSLVHSGMMDYYGPRPGRLEVEP